MTATRPFRDELTLHLPSLHARALKLCLNATEAQDLVQDTVERALRFESSYQPGTNLRAWAQQVLFSVFVTRCRKNRRERRRESLKEAAIEVFSEKGYHAAKVSDIVERVGVARRAAMLASSIDTPV